MTSNMWLNTLPNGKILDKSKLKAIADNKINVTEIFEKKLGKGRKHCEKMLVTSIFSYSHIVFKSCFPKCHDCVTKD